MSIGIAANICRDTATSANWKVTQRAVADDLGAGLDQLIP
jgi:hypothetical protein